MRDQLPGPIRHVVVLMLENRGFDHVMGWLYAAGETPTIDSQPGDTRPFLGLSTLSAPQLAGLANPLPASFGPQPAVPINAGARSPRAPTFNTGESFEHIMNQMWGVGRPAADWLDPLVRGPLLQQLSQAGTVAPPMTGYVLDYDLDVAHHTHRQLDADQLGEVLDTYLPAQLPVLSGLARAYAVSDEWYCSVPSQTNTNRAFSMAGTSRGMVNNSFYDPFAGTTNLRTQLLLARSGGISNADALPASTRSVFEVLQQAGFSWKVYWQTPWPPAFFTPQTGPCQYVRTMLPLLGNAQFDPNFVQFDAADPRNAFLEAARNGTLPALTWIEPKWGGGAEWSPPPTANPRGVGNDMHPVSDTTVAEDFVAEVYAAVAAGPAWDDTLLVITFDENGGTYDHLPPPAALPSGNDAVPLHVPKTGDTTMDPATRTQFGFDFAQYGVRVPTLLVSPRIGPSTIFRSTGAPPFDHTSLIATILRLAGVPQARWQLGTRVDNAPTFEHLLAGPPRVIADPLAALDAPDARPVADSLDYQRDYVFQYIGDPWHVRPAPCWLAASTRGRGALWYPRLTTDRTQALRLRLVPGDGGGGVAPVMNMATVRIVTSEDASLGFTLLCVDPRMACAYYARDAGYEGTRWQVRLLSSRDPTQALRVGDRVFFVSRLGPAFYQSSSELFTPDPLQRLLPWPDDPTFLTTRAGEWALWQLAYALGDDNV